MAVSEESRHLLYQRLEAVLGSEHATTLMEHLPPVGWADVATKRDLDHLAAATRRDLEEHRAETRRDLEEHRAETRRDLEEHRAETRRDLEEHRAETRADLAEVRGDLGSLRADLDDLRTATGRNFEEMRHEVGHQFADLRSGLRSDLTSELGAQFRSALAAESTSLEWRLTARMEKEMRAQTWRFMTAISTAVLALSSLILARPHI